jgi:GNAT superfamily N-acetyltransferase
MKIQILEKSRLKSIQPLVPDYAYASVFHNIATAVCAYDENSDGDSERPVGALVYSMAPDVFENGEREYLIDSLYVAADRRREGVAKALVQYLERLAALDDNVTGISINLPIPELSDVAEVFKALRFKHRMDGNRIYRVPVKVVLALPALEAFAEAAMKCHIESFNKANNVSLNRFFRKFGSEIPEWLNPLTYGGELQKDLSFVGYTGDEITSFLACTIYEPGVLYLGGMYTPNSAGLLAGALLSYLEDALIKRKDIHTLIFSAATDASDALARHVFKKTKEEDYVQVMSNFYKSII